MFHVDTWKTLCSTAKVTAPTISHTPTRSPWPVFAVCATAAYLTTLDLSIVNVAFPEILRTFGSTNADVSWIVTIYNICFGSLLVVAGKAADQLGRKRLFTIGLSVFLIGSALCAIAPNLGLLIAGRAVQGVGGALLSPASLGLLLAAFPPERRTQIVAMWGGIGALGVASGPSLGALLISLTDWRAAFWLNLPVCAALLVAGRKVLAETPRVQSAHRPDYAGALLVTIALAMLALGISRSDVWGWGDARTIGALVVAVVAVPVFIARQRRHPEPVLDLTLFEHRTFSVANAGGLVFYAGFAALGLNSVLFLRGVWGYTVLHAGLLSALAPLTVALLAPFSGRLAARHGFRRFVTVGPVLVATAMVINSMVLDAEPSPWLFVAMGELAAVGIASFIPVNSAAAVSTLPPPRLSIGGAINNTARQVGSVFGITLLVAVLGTSTSLGELVDAHHRGFLLVAGLMVASAMVSSLRTHRA
ncbi:MAG TPA: MFS transporter [Acidimicrobiaceae bacterium]|nr:MFS transporter [Acidimicrobiaceae bacterium]